jgi:hypothetical protein
LKHCPSILSLLFGLFVVSPAMAQGPTKRECAAANETAQDLRSMGRLREARQKLAICTAESCPGAIREDCGQRLQEVDAAIPTITIAAVDASGRDLTGVRVTMDDQPLLQQLGGTAMTVDPGEHHFIFDAPGYREKVETFVVREGEHNRDLRVVLESTAPSPTPATSPPPPVVVTPKDDGTMMRTAGLAIGGAGAAGIVIGAVFGIVSKLTYDQGMKGCAANNVNDCSSTAVKDDNTAHTQATVSTVAFVAGAALLAGGIALYLTAPNGSEVALAANMVNGGGGLSVGTKW